MKSKAVTLLTTIAALTAVMALAGPASAARTTDTIVCGAETLTLTVTSVDSDNAPAWGVGTISVGTHLIPTSFSFTATDLNTGDVLFSDTQAKGNGNGQHNEQTITCSGVPEQATAGELGIPGVDPSHVVQFDFTVTAVRKP